MLVFGVVRMDEFEYFEVVENHIKLIDGMWVGWEDCEFGAPAIDCKRPYGNSSVYYDIASIVGLISDWKKINDDDFEFLNEEYEYMDLLHQGTQKVLQIIIHTKKFETGFYKKKKFSGEGWFKIDDSELPEYKKEQIKVPEMPKPRN